MRLLLDANVLLWWFVDPPAIGAKAFEALCADEAEIWVSPVSLWELAIKHKSGKLPQAAALLSDPALIAGEGFVELPIVYSHAIRAGALPLHHRDPFDRLIAAQALVERLTVVSSDRVFDVYGVERFWR